MEQSETRKKIIQLSAKVAELEKFIDEIVQEKNSYELLNFPWVGNLGQWYWLVQSNKVYFNDKKVTTLGYSMDEVPEEVGFDFFTSKLHKDDYDNVMDNMRDHLKGKRESYEVEYRIRTKDGSYKWYYDRGKVTKTDDNDKPLLLSGIVFDVSKNKEIENELKIANSQLHDLLIHDDLTKVYNRRYLYSKLENIINEQKQHFSIILFDIDNFKLVNDKHGHVVGDSVLVEITKTCLKAIGEDGLLFRWGGEEFIVLLPDSILNKAISMAEKIRINIAKCPLESCGQVTASFGVSSFKEGENINSIIKRVDSLMFKAKESGRNCVKF